jgi:hypothetical protein
MNAALLALLAKKNSTDLEAIVARVGLPTLIALLPYISNIMQTILAAQAAKTV